MWSNCRPPHSMFATYGTLPGDGVGGLLWSLTVLVSCLFPRSLNLKPSNLALVTHGGGRVSSAEPTESLARPSLSF